ncbi:bifunctional 5,10-methylenetetrahydrofolate dehydrogenase/5,10-methenyltetrahydrofolate cyclohydrolase [Candidatus Parcubacteria bacterium]|nr:bifunctional 5,10-methylenetetrahydrofolate dehydrogenase/5,10-methenyltetrahydrofolate cyclohydrolase [Candidatus Parcubacteria bacterium]
MIADGKAVAKILEQELQAKLADLPQRKVCFILFGNDAESRQFITMKSNVAERLGITVDVLHYSESVSMDEAVEIVQKAAEKDYSGIVVQLPLPAGLDRERILNSVPPRLDIDVLSEEGKRDYAAGNSSKVPPVARAVHEILNFYHVELAGKEILILGKGKLVGEPVSAMLSLKNIPFKMADGNTPEEEKAALIKSADIIISGVGSPHFLKPDMIKEGVVLIDAGTSEQAGKLVGDIDPACSERAALITPVPGGVGPVTVVSLFLNIR